MKKKLLIGIPAVLLVLLVGGYFLANYQVRAIVDAHISDFLASGDYQALDYEAVQLELNGDISLQNLHVIDSAGNEYILENIRVSNYDYFNPIPRHLDLVASGMRLPAGIPMFGQSPNRTLNAYLESIMTADHLPIELHYSYHYAPENNLQLDSSFSVELPDSLLLTSDSVMRNVPLEQFNTGTPAPNANPVQSSMLIQNADIPSARVALQDLGVVAAMMAIQGEALGISADDYRQQLLGQLQAMALFVPVQLQTLAQDLLVNLVVFLEGGSTLRFSIAPEYGGNVQRLQGEVMGAFYIGDFARIVELLNLEIETF